MQKAHRHSDCLSGQGEVCLSGQSKIFPLLKRKAIVEAYRKADKNGFEGEMLGAVRQCEAKPLVYSLSPIKSRASVRKSGEGKTDVATNCMCIARTCKIFVSMGRTITVIFCGGR